MLYTGDTPKTYILVLKKMGYWQKCFKTITNNGKISVAWINVFVLKLRVPRYTFIYCNKFPR